MKESSVGYSPISVVSHQTDPFWRHSPLAVVHTEEGPTVGSLALQTRKPSSLIYSSSQIPAESSCGTSGCYSIPQIDADIEDNYAHS